MNAKLLWQRNMLRLLLLGLVVTAVFYWTPFLWKVLGPFIVALALAAALQPAIRRLDRLRVNRSVSTLLLLVLVYAVIALLVYWFTSFVVRQAISALQNAPQWLQGINDIYQRFRAWITKMFEESDRLEQMIILGNDALRVSAREFKKEVEQVNEEISAFRKQLARRNEIENPNKLKIE